MTQTTSATTQTPTTHATSTNTLAATVMAQNEPPSEAERCLAIAVADATDDGAPRGRVLSVDWMAEMRKLATAARHPAAKMNAARCRMCGIDWMARMCNALTASTSTLSLAVNLFDVYMTERVLAGRFPENSGDVTLVVITAVRVAMKFNEDVPKKLDSETLKRAVVMARSVTNVALRIEEINRLNALGFNVHDRATPRTIMDNLGEVFREGLFAATRTDVLVRVELGSALALGLSTDGPRPTGSTDELGRAARTSRCRFDYYCDYVIDLALEAYDSLVSFDCASLVAAVGYVARHAWLSAWIAYAEETCSTVGRWANDWALLIADGGDDREAAGGRDRARVIVGFLTRELERDVFPDPERRFPPLTVSIGALENSATTVSTMTTMTAATTTGATTTTATTAETSTATTIETPTATTTETPTATTTISESIRFLGKLRDAARIDAKRLCARKKIIDERLVATWPSGAKKATGLSKTDARHAAETLLCGMQTARNLKAKWFCSPGGDDDDVCGDDCRDGKSGRIEDGIDEKYRNRSVGSVAFIGIPRPKHARRRK